MGHEEPFKSDPECSRRWDRTVQPSQLLERLSAALKRWGDSRWARRRCTDAARPLPFLANARARKPGDYGKSCSPAKYEQVIVADTKLTPTSEMGEIVRSYVAKNSVAVDQVGATDWGRYTER